MGGAVGAHVGGVVARWAIVGVVPHFGGHVGVALVGALALGAGPIALAAPQVSAVVIHVPRTRRTVVVFLISPAATLLLLLLILDAGKTKRFSTQIFSPFTPREIPKYYLHVQLIC